MAVLSVLYSTYEQDCVVAGWPAAKMQKSEKWKILPAFR